jgi:hypothetical protein
VYGRKAIGGSNPPPSAFARRSELRRTQSARRSRRRASPGSASQIYYVKKIIKQFFLWYERHYKLNVGITSALFLLQLVHLYWLTTHVLFVKLFGIDLFHSSATFDVIISLVDYTEIPALISASVLYINELQKRFQWSSIRNLILINSQWLHLFWITDEFVVSQFTNNPGGNFPFWLALIAILIDYLEFPVMFDVVRRFIKSMKKK